MLTTIGISGLNHNLQQVKEPGIYWVNTCSAEAAVYLAALCAGNAEAEHTADLLIMQPDLLARLPDYVGSGQDSNIEVISCAHDEKNEACFFADLTCYLQHHKKLPRGVIVTAAAERAGRSSPDKARQVFRKLNCFCRQQGVAVLIICYSAGNPDNELSLLLRRNGDYLQGRAELRYSSGTELAWQVLFWHTALEFYVNQYFFLQQGEHGELQVVPSTIRQDGVLAENIIISNSKLLQNSMAGNSNLIYVDSIEKVYRRGLFESICYLVFEISDMDSLPQLTHSIYHLRRRCGDFLKIAVLPDPNLRLRTHAQLLLIRSGANTVFEHNAGFGYIAVMLSALRNAVYSQVLPYSYDLIEQAQFIMQHRGFVDAETFYRLMDIELQQDPGLSELINGALIVLKRRPRTEMRKSITQFIPSRYGDIATAFRDEMVVYLLGVSTGNADHALRRLFSMNPNLLFASIDFYFTYESIIAELRQLKKRHYKDAGIIDRSGAVQLGRQVKRRTTREGVSGHKETGQLEIVTLSPAERTES